MKHAIVNTIKAIFLLLAAVFGSLFWNQYLTDTIGFDGIIYYLPLFVFFSTLSLLFPIPLKNVKWISNLPLAQSARLNYLFLLILIGSSIFSYHFAKTYSPTLFSASFYWDAGIHIDFMKNGTFKVRNDDWIVGSVSYGKYKMTENEVIMLDKVRLGSSPLKDTLLIHSKGLEFFLNTQWKTIHGGVMQIKKCN